MKLNIIPLDTNEFSVQGQTVSREFAEGAMLSGLLASAGKSVPAMANIIDQYEAVGLRATNFPDQLRKVQIDRAARAREEAQRKADAEYFAERAREMATAHDPLVLARKKAERERRASQARQHGEAIRAARGGRPYALEGYDPDESSGWGL
ncbi:hypothetical protein ACNFIC_00715 [Pseudomonas sp. NY15463]|uniref:hypothetical protein n=1 Tax=Pseudomonas sp. NY15463 TaxID=3400361 RepID=UPI003A84E250